MCLEGSECRKVFSTFKHKVVGQQFIQNQLTMNSLFATIRAYLILLSILTWYAGPYLILMLEPSDKLGRHVLFSVLNNVKNLVTSVVDQETH